MAEQRLVENYCVVASTTLLWFDYALTFADEVRQIWRGKLHGATITYLCIRYTLLLERVVIMLEVLWSSDDQTCGGVTHADDAIFVLNYLAIASLTILRIYAISGRDWRTLLVVVPVCLINPVLLIVETSTYVPDQEPFPVGCTYRFKLQATVTSRLGLMAVVSTIVANTMLLLVTWYRTWSIRRGCPHFEKNPFLTMLMRNGTVYFVVLLFNLAMKIRATWDATATLLVVWPYFCEVFTAMILSRFMLALRGIYYTEGTESSASSIVFHHTTLAHKSLLPSRFNLVGNLGATVGTLTRTVANETTGSQCAWEDGSEELDVPHFSGDPFREGLLGRPEPAV